MEVTESSLGVIESGFVETNGGLTGKTETKVRRV